MSPLRIVFAGTPEFGVPCVDTLYHSRHEVIAVYTQPDRPAGRGRKMQASAVKEWALENKLPVYQPAHFKTSEALDELASLQPDLLVVIAYGLILPQAVLAIPRLGCVNVHASLLPRWRGASPIQQAILHGDKQSGVTIMQMDAGMDTGPILATASCEINETETAGSLHDKLAKLSAEPLLSTVERLAQGLVHPEAQDNHLATYASKINKEEGLIDWQEDARCIDQKIRAFNPWPIAYTHIGEEQIRIHQASLVSNESDAIPGTILRLDKKGMLVAAQTGALRVEKIQFPGAKVVGIADWLNSGKETLRVGMVLQ